MISSHREGNGSLICPNFKRMRWLFARRGSVALPAFLVTAILLAACDSVLPSVEKANSAALHHIVNQYLAAQQRADIDAAYGLLCPDGREDRDDFAGRVHRTADDIGRIDGWIIGIADELSNGRGVVQYTVTTDSGSFERKVDLIRVGDDWCLSDIDG